MKYKKNKKKKKGLKEIRTNPQSKLKVYKKNVQKFLHFKIKR